MSEHPHPYPQVQKMLDDLWESKRKKIRITPQHSNRASELGHPCLRYLVFLRTRYQEQALYSVALQWIFDLGRKQEQIALENLAEAGYHVVEQQRPLVWEKYNITGHIDGKVEMDGKLVPIEIKGISPHLWNAVNDIDDFLRPGETKTILRKSYVRKMPSQLITYCLLGNSSEGFLYLQNKITAQPKIIWLYLESYMEEAERLIKRAEMVNRMVADKQTPDMINDESVCEGCSFEHICLPDRMLGKQLQIINEDPELLSDLERHAELKPLSNEYKELNEKLKKQFDGIENGTIGDYVISSKKIHNKGGTKTTDPYDYWLTRWHKIKKKEN